MSKRSESKQKEEQLLTRCYKLLHLEQQLLLLAGQRSRLAQMKPKQETELWRSQLELLLILVGLAENSTQ